MASLEVILVVVVVVVVVDALSIDVQALYLGSLMLSCPRSFAHSLKAYLSELND